MTLCQVGSQSQSGGGGGSGSGRCSKWVEDHPFLEGLIPSAPSVGAGASAALVAARAGGTTNSSREELGALRKRMGHLTNAVMGRRAVAREDALCYHGHNGTTDPTDDVDDGEEEKLYGALIPESVALLSFGLLLRLAHLSRPIIDEGLESVSGGSLGEWGAECARAANDDCAAFVYLLRTFRELGGSQSSASGSGGGERWWLLSRAADRGVVQALATGNNGGGGGAADTPDGVMLLTNGGDDVLDNDDNGGHVAKQ